jgi:hypothetical protein
LQQRDLFPQRLAGQEDQVQPEVPGGLDQTRLAALVAYGEEAKPFAYRHLAKGLANERFNCVRRTPQPAADADGDPHAQGLTIDHWVTGIAGRMA